MAARQLPNPPSATFNAPHAAEGNNPGRLPSVQGENINPTRRNADPVPARVPFPPARPAMESIDMETYLNIAHVARRDTRTRAQLQINGINHWTFFRASNEEELTRLGFPLGIARLLCEGVARLEVYVDEMERGAIEMSPIL
jgi:hypothetical protein